MNLGTRQGGEQETENRSSSTPPKSRVTEVQTLHQQTEINSVEVRRNGEAAKDQVRTREGKPSEICQEKTASRSQMDSTAAIGGGQADGEN